MVAINAGDLNHEYVLQKPSAGLDPSSYDDIDTIWGAQMSARGNELLRFETPHATGSYVVTIRYREDLQASWRLFEPSTGRSLQISSFGDPDGNAEQLQIYCVEVQ